MYDKDDLLVVDDSLVSLKLLTESPTDKRCVHKLGTFAY